jgi:plasmid stability protein
MGALTVRKVADELIRALKLRAAQHGRSAEAEHRFILEQALKPMTETFKGRMRRRRESFAGRDFSDNVEISVTCAMEPRDLALRNLADRI